jgi:GNAT superfamily N-acetyltransferase
VLEGTVRLALPQDAECLFTIRYEAIQVIAPRGMPPEVAHQWATRRTLDWMHAKIADGRVWLFEAQGQAVGWISLNGSTVSGLYTHPSCERRGVGSRLLAFAEDYLRTSGEKEVTLKSSWSAESFYLERGYVADGPRPPEGSRQMRKHLNPDRRG